MLILSLKILKEEIKIPKMPKNLKEYQLNPTLLIEDQELVEEKNWVKEELVKETGEHIKMKIKKSLTKKKKLKVKMKKKLFKL